MYTTTILNWMRSQVKARAMPGIGLAAAQQVTQQAAIQQLLQRAPAGALPADLTGQQTYQRLLTRACLSSGHLWALPHP